MNVEWLPEAVRNLETQIAYIAERNPWAAIDMGDAIEATIGRPADFPESARPGRVPGTCELAVTGTPYIVVYRIETDAALILRVLHGVCARGGEQWMRRKAALTEIGWTHRL